MSGALAGIEEDRGDKDGDGFCVESFILKGANNIKNVLMRYFV